MIDSIINAIFNKFIFLEKLKSCIRDRIKILSQVWSLMPIILAFQRQWQENYQEFEASLGYKIRPCLKNQQQKIS